VAQNARSIRLPVRRCSVENPAAQLTAANLTDRYLWGPKVDQLLADEQVTSLAADGNVLWTLGDNQNTIRDVVDCFASVGTGR
jgi:hypothetical protein